MNELKVPPFFLLRRKWQIKNLSLPQAKQEEASDDSGSGEEASGSEKSGSGSSDSEEEGEAAKKGAAGSTEIENPNHVVKKTKKIGDLEVAAEAKPELSRREREELEKQRARENYQRLHAQGKTDEARADLARLAIIRQQREEAAKKREEEKKSKWLIILNASLFILKIFIFYFFRLLQARNLQWPLKTRISRKPSENELEM